MPRLPRVLVKRLASAHRAAASAVSALPAYQVAFWPDGWVLETGGGVLVQDTHAMAEARRWYVLAERKGTRKESRRIMAMHGISVPREILGLANRRFPCERSASVAVQLVAAEWVRQRRRQLLESPLRALAEHGRAWSGSRHRPGLQEEDIGTLVAEMIRTCVGERLIPDACYGIGVRRGDGYGIAGFRCTLDVCLDPYACARVADNLGTALVPWNRAVMRDGTPALYIDLKVRSGHILRE